MSEGTTKLCAALVAAQSAAKAVEKASKNQHQGYKYASTEAIITEAREHLSENGLALFRVDSNVTWEDPRDVTKDGKTKTVRVGTVNVFYVLAHESGERQDIDASTPAVAEAGRPEDKAVATALTYSLGYVLRDLLLLPRVEEGTDVDQRDDSRHEPAPRRKRDTTPAPPPVEAAWEPRKMSAEDLISGFATATDRAEVEALTKSAVMSELPEAERAPVREAMSAAKKRLA